MKYFIRLLLTTVLLFKIFTGVSQTVQYKKYENVVYGMVSNTSLLMDVYQPYKTNDIGILIIPGSAFGSIYPKEYDQPQLKDDFTYDSAYIGKWARALIDKGFTVFIINHRFAPLFHHAEIFSDCQRAVRFIRFNAKKYGIDADNIGAFGHSSGATLCSLLGLTDTSIKNSTSQIDSLSSKVQSVVALEGIYDLTDVNKKEDSTIWTSFDLKIISDYMGELPSLDHNGNFILSGKYAEASPITHVTSDASPLLIYYSDNDPIVPQRQAIAMYNKLLANKVRAVSYKKHNSEHNPIPDMDEVNKWFIQTLKK